MIPTNQEQDLKPGKSVQNLKPILMRGLLPLGIVLFGWIGYSILSIKPDEAKRPEEKPRIIKTRVIELRVQDYPTLIRTQGVIRPHNEVTLTVQVSGNINRLLPGFEDGAFFSKGEVLMELDPADYETVVLSAEAQLARASATHAQEETRSNQARRNWDDLGYKEEPNDLVLRIPQLREAEANVKSATAQLAKTNRDLERTKIRAPFDGRVRRRVVGLGQTVGTGTPLGTIFAIDYAEVRLPLTSQKMEFLTLPEGVEDPPVEVELKDSLNPENQTIWHAEIIRTEGTLDERSLELFAIARINDPFGRTSGTPPLRIGQPVLGFIPGRILKDVLVIPRIAVRQLDRILLIDKN